MRTNTRSNALLIELLIVIFFFMISATVLLRIFVAARTQGARAEMMAEATVRAQNIAEQLYASEDSEETLLAAGFIQTGDSWQREEASLLTEVSLTDDYTESGILHRGVIHISSEGETLLTIPCTRFEEVNA